MAKIKVKVQLTEEALKEFREIQSHENGLVSQWGVKYLKGLLQLPAKSWLDVSQRWEKGAFKISDIIPFDIRGKVENGSAAKGIEVFITRFKLKASHSPVWFERLREEKVLNWLLELESL